MEDEARFKVPVLIPQDLQLIQDIVGELNAHKARIAKEEADESVNSPDNDTDSEKEVEDGILAGVEEDEGASRRASGPSSPTDEESSSESSPSESEDDPMPSKPFHDDDLDEDDDPVGANLSSAQLRTKNEVPEPEMSIAIPVIDEVGPEEHLEKVGEITSILNATSVIVKGSAAGEGSHGRAAERALDSDTLLVFGDRKVLGYIYETFGPTHQPMYQVKFNSQYPLDTEKVQVAKEVFHVPSRSNFVFVRQLKALRGSDASNAHDEEPADDELEFSDDEEERAHRKTLERKREEARGGASSSRFTSPVSVPSRVRDQEIAAEDMYGSYDYSSSSYNDMDFGAGPSRPPPVPYDDPYSDLYGLDIPVATTSTTGSANVGTVPDSMHEDREVRKSPNVESRPSLSRGRGGRRDERGRGRGRDRGGRRGGDRGRGRGRGRSGGSGADDQSWVHRPPPHRASASHSPTEEYSPRQSQNQSRSLSPTSAAIARATGQFADGSSYNAYAQHPPQPQGQAWGYSPTQQSFDFGYGAPPGYVQPHINPRFAGQFGFNVNLGFTQRQQLQPYAYDTDYSVPISAEGTGTGTWPSNNQWNSHNGPSQSGSPGS